MSISNRISLEDVLEAGASQDPDYSNLLEDLVSQGRDESVPVNENIYDYYQFADDLKNRSFRQKTLEEQQQIRTEKIESLNEGDVPGRFRSHESLLDMWRANDLFSRNALLESLRTIPFVYGPWKAIKTIFKEAEAANDTEVLGLISARLDMMFDGSQPCEVSKRTVAYLCRRAWRYLRRLGERLPACYVDAATDFLVGYEHYGSFQHSWIFNHIFFHEDGEYGGKQFRYNRYSASGKYKHRPSNFLKHRAFKDLWTRSSRPIFSLLERARNGRVLAFAVSALKAEFRTELREVEPEWVARLASVRNSDVDEFVIWILETVPRFEQAKFRDLGLHDVVLMLLESESRAARKYALSYARTHARDLPLENVFRLATTYYDEIHKFLIDLLRDRDPRKEVGLEAWGRLLSTDSIHSFAADSIRKHFSAKELTPEWFARRILNADDSYTVQEFAFDNLLKVHSLKELGSEFFFDLGLRLDPSHWNYDTIRFISRHLKKFKLADTAQDRLQKFLLHPETNELAMKFVNQGEIKPKLFGTEFLKEIAFHPSWEENEVVRELRENEFWDGKSLGFSEEMSACILQWLADVREFAPRKIGFEWLMKLVERTESRYQQFAVQVLTKSFEPADFAPSDPDEDPQDDADSDVEINVDLAGATFVFTGKLKTMTRSEAQKKVTAVNGKNSNSVTGKLNYLVIGDEGSPLYGEGRKGSKQVKAESLNKDGAEIKIISETAFLKMLAGETGNQSEDSVAAGCQQLWEWLTQSDRADAPKAKFALTYLRYHHAEICLKETDRPVDPTAEIPDSFLTFDQMKSLFFDQRTPLRKYALEIAHYEFAKWSPPMSGIVELFESPFADVKRFVSKALTCEDLPENKSFRLNTDNLTTEAVYSFCEAKDPQTRALGMQLVERVPRLRNVDELFRLTESPDRKVRNFVIRSLWQVFRDRGIKTDWKPDIPEKATTGKKKKPTQEELDEQYGVGAPVVPDHLPAEHTQLAALLRQILFELPPGRPPRKRDGTENLIKLKPLPARKAKLHLIESYRDIALDDADFAKLALPILQEFMESRGKSERDACLVAVTRLESHYPELKSATSALESGT